MATFVKFAVYKPMGFPLKIHYIDTAGNPIIGADGQPMIKLIDLTKTAATESDGFIDLKNVLYAQAIDGYEFTSNINTGNAEESKTLVGAETGEISGAPENRKYTIGSYTGYQLRFIKYDNGTFYAAMGNRTGNNRFAITGKPAVYLTYKRTAPLDIELGTLNVGDKVKSNGAVYYGQPIKWLVIGKNHDADNTVTLLSEKILCLKCFDAKEPNNSNSGRRDYGNNRYLYSNLLQWLNSSASAGQWYSPRHEVDQIPDGSHVYGGFNPYDTEAGFLSAFSSDIRNALMETSKITAKSTSDGGGQEIVTAKVHLLSKTEIGLGTENSVTEGKTYDYFSQDGNRRKAYPSEECIANTSYKDSGFKTSSPWRYWLRTPWAGYSYCERRINPDGALHNTYYSSGALGGDVGVLPMITLSSSTLCQPTPDADGTYIMQI